MQGAQFLMERPRLHDARSVLTRGRPRLATGRRGGRQPLSALPFRYYRDSAGSRGWIGSRPTPTDLSLNEPGRAGRGGPAAEGPARVWFLLDTALPDPINLSRGALKVLLDRAASGSSHSPAAATRPTSTGSTDRGRQRCSLASAGARWIMGATPLDPAHSLGGSARCPCPRHNRAWGPFGPDPGPGYPGPGGPPAPVRDRALAAQHRPDRLHERPGAGGRDGPAVPGAASRGSTR